MPSAPFGAVETVTIRRLLSHESGLMGDPRTPTGRLNRYEGSPLRNLARVGDIGTRVPPNTQQKYSNLGYQLLGEIVARVSGVPYVAYVREQILRSAGHGCPIVRPAPAATSRPDRAAGYQGAVDVR